MSNHQYLNSENLNNFKNMLQAVFDNDDYRKEIMNDQYTYKDRSINQYFDKDSVNKYISRFNAEKRKGLLGVNNRECKEHYKILLFKFILNNENQIIITYVSYRKQLANKFSCLLGIENNYDDINDSLIKDNFKIKALDFKMSFDDNTFMTFKNNELFIETDHLNYVKRSNQYKKVEEYITLFTYLYEKENIDLNQILHNKTFTLIADNLELYYLENDKKIDFKKSCKKLMCLSGKIDDSVITQALRKRKPLASAMGWMSSDE